MRKRSRGRQNESEAEQAHYSGDVRSLSGESDKNVNRYAFNTARKLLPS